MPRRRAHRQLADRRRDVERGVGPLLLVAVQIVRILADHAAGEDVDVRIHSCAREHRAHAAHEGRSEHAGGQHAPALAGLDDVFDVLGAERHHAADRAGAVDVGDRPAHDVDRREHLRLEIEHPVGVVAGALEVLPRAVDQHGDAPEILQAANVDGGAGIIAARLRGHAGHAEEDLRRAGRHQLLELVGGHAGRCRRLLRLGLSRRGRRGDVCRLHRRRTHGAHRGQRLAHPFPRLGGNHGDRIKLDRRGLCLRRANAAPLHQRNSRNAEKKRLRASSPASHDNPHS